MQTLRFRCRKCKKPGDFVIDTRFNDLPPGIFFTICPNCGIEGIENEANALKSDKQGLADEVADA